MTRAAAPAKRAGEPSNRYDHGSGMALCRPASFGAFVAETLLSPTYITSTAPDLSEKPESQLVRLSPGDYVFAARLRPHCTTSSEIVFNDQDRYIPLP